jgi:hypothetical protein
MKTQILIATGIALAALANTAVSIPAHALTMAECSAKYKAAKDAGTLNGTKWNDFRKEQCGAQATAAPAAAPAPASAPAAAPAPAPAPTSTATAPTANTQQPATKKPMTPGQEAFHERERECGKEWKADKAAGKVAAGMTWPKYLSACNKRLKGQA